MSFVADPKVNPGSSSENPDLRRDRARTRSRSSPFPGKRGRPRGYPRRFPSSGLDPFRPNVQLKTFLASLATHPRLTPAAVHAARVLLEDGVQHRYPLSQKTLEPASMPKHYRRLVQGYDRSARGIARPWWQVFFGVWR